MRQFTAPADYEGVVRDLLSSRVTLERELHGVDRVQVNPRERETAEFTVDAAELGVVWNDRTSETEPRTFKLVIGDRSTEFEVTSRYR